MLRNSIKLRWRLPFEIQRHNSSTYRRWCACVYLSIRAWPQVSILSFWFCWQGKCGLKQRCSTNQSGIRLSLPQHGQCTRLQRLRFSLVQSFRDVTGSMINFGPSESEWYHSVVLVHSNPGSWMERKRMRNICIYVYIPNNHYQEEYIYAVPLLVTGSLHTGTKSLNQSRRHTSTSYVINICIQVTRTWQWHLFCRYGRRQAICWPALHCSDW